MFSRLRTAIAALAVSTLLVSLLQVIVLPTPAGAATPQANAPMRMTVGSSNPLLLTQMNIGNDMGQTEGFKRNWNSGWSFAQIWASVPDDIKGNIGFVLHQGHTALADNRPAENEKWLEDNVKEADALGIPVFILWDEGRTLKSNSTRFTFLEHLYQTYPNFMGTVVSEQADTLSDLTEALRIANLYGGFHVLGSLEETNGLASFLENQTNWNNVTSYKKNFIFNPKNFHENFETVNAWTQGAWLSGAFDNWGPYFDGYPYYGCGYFGLNTSGYSQCGDRWSRSMAETVASMMMLDQWQNGATVFHMENQLDMPTTGSLYSPYFYQSILPAMRYILTHPTPTKADVVAKTKVVFSEAAGNMCTLTDSEAGRSSNPCRPTFYSMYELQPALTAIQKTLPYYLRSDGRYGIIPRIPKLASSSVLAQFDTVLTKANYNPTLIYGDARDTLIDSKYPQISSGEAFVQKTGSSWLMYNTNDRDNFNQDATLFLGGSTFTQLTMPEVTPHTWAMVTEEGTSISVLLDTYRSDRTADLLSVSGVRDMEFNRNFVKYAYVPNPQDAALRTTTMTFDVAVKPTLTISGYDRNSYTYTETWNPNTHQYTLTVQSNGVVDIKLSTSSPESGWTTVSPGSAQIATGSGATEFAFDGTSVAWAVPAGYSGTASVSIDGVLQNSAVPLAGGGTVFRATGLTNSVHVLRVEGGEIPVDHFSYVPSVEHSATLIETNDFNYGTAATDEDVLYGSDGWRVINGKLKLVGFVFPFYGDTTVYNSNLKLQNVKYEAKVTLVQGTSGSIFVRGNEDTKAGYFFRLDPNRTAEGRTGSAGYSCSLHSGAAGALNSWTAIATCPTSLTLNRDQEYSVVLTANGGTITASIDGTQVLSYSSAAQSSGYTGVRAPQAQSDSGNRLGQFVQIDDVTLTNLDTNTVVYQSSFGTWADATGWMTETALVFDWNTKADPRSSFTFPWQWTRTAGTWQLVENAVNTSGFSGYFSATAPAATDFSAFGGAESAWSTNGGYDYWAWLNVTSGTTAGLTVRATDAANMYQARIDVSSQTVSFGRLVNGVWTQLASAASPVPLAQNSWDLVKVTAHGSLFTVDVGGKLALTAVDTTFATGGAGVWVPASGSTLIEDARVVARPAVVSTARTAATVVPADGINGRHITGYDYLAVKTARTKQPAMPTTVTARYSDGTTGQVTVTWPAITAGQLAVATNPTVTGPNQGKFTVQGTVAGTTLTVPARITVMPNLTTSFSITGSYNPASPTTPTQMPGTGTFSDGTSTWTKTLYVRWINTPVTTAGSPTTQVISGEINGYPWEKLSATMTVTVPPVTTAPGAPTGVSAIGGNSQATVSWTAPASTGNSAITGYTATASPGGATCTTTGATSCSVAGLINGTPYTFTVTATNAIGTSDASTVSAAATPQPGASVPSAPTSVTAVAGSGQATVSWSAPVSDGGAAISGYTVSASAGGATCSTTGATSCIVYGLTNGTAYTFTVTAQNSAGSSAASSASASVTPIAINLALNKTVTSYYTFGGSSATNNTNRAPSKMVDGVSTPSVNSSADSGYFTGGVSEGTVTNYVAPNGELCSWAYVDLGADYQIGSYSVLFGQNQTTSGNKMWDSPYTIQVLSSADAAASTTTLRNSSICAARTVVSGKGTGNFTTAAYVVSPANDIWTTVSTGIGTLTFDNHTLSTPATARYVRILLNEPTTAQVYGTSVMELAVYAPVVTPPGTPTATTATAGDGSATVSWTAPGSNGGSAITGYTVTAAPGGATCTTTSTISCVVPGLANGTAYTFTVKAQNVAGSSSASASTSSVTPLGVPLATTAPPVITGSAVVGQQLVVTDGTWNVAGANYTYQWFRDGSAITSATSSNYLVGTADVGAGLTVAVAATKTGHPSGSSISTPVTPRRAHTVAVLTASAASQTFAGAPVTLTITVTTESGSAASGSVTILDGSTVLVADVELDPSGSITYDLPAALSAGAHSLRAEFTPDDAATFDGSTSSTVAVIVLRATTTTLFTLSRTSQVHGASSPAIVSVEVLAGGVTVPGAVAIKDGSTTLVSGLALDSFGEASFTLPATLAVGSHSITVEFTPDDTGSYESSSAADQSFTVAASSSTTTLAVSAGSQQYGALSTVQLTAHTELENGAHADGTVAFLDGSTVLATGIAVDASGDAEFALPSSLGAGNHYLSAVFTPADETLVAASQSSPAALVIVTAATSMAVLSLSASTQVIGGTPVTATVEVDLSNGQVADGTVTITDGSTVLASGVALDAAGIATVPLSSALTSGAHVIGASFVPSDAVNVTGASASTVTLTVSRATTTTAVTLSSPSQVFGAASPTTVEITVDDVLGNTGVGTVAVLDGTTTLAPALTLDGSGDVTFTLPANLAVGAHALTAVFTPANASTTQGSTSSTAALTVLAAATTTAVSLPGGSTQPYAGAHVVSIQVNASTSAAVIGTVSVLDGSTVVAAGITLNSSGAATYLLDPLLPSGSHSLSAQFAPASGSGLSASTSPSVVLVVDPSAPPTPPVWSDDTVTVAQATVALNDGVKAVGSGTISYALTGGALPSWLAFSETTGALTGTPAESDAGAAYSFAVTASSAYGDVSTTVAGTVAAAPEVSLDASLVAGALAAGSTGDIEITGAGATVPWSLTLFSTPVVVASGTTSASGAASSAFTLPAQIEAGAHRLELRTSASDGSARTTTVWFTVMRNGTVGTVSLTGPVSYLEAALAATGVELVAGGMAALLLLGIGVLLVLRRRSIARLARVVAE